MASFTVATGEIGVRDKTLTAATVDTVTFTGRDCDRVEVLSDGTAAIYFTVDGSAPTVSGNNTYKIPAVAAAREVPVPSAGDTAVRLISSGTPKYDVSEVQR